MKFKLGDKVRIGQSTHRGKIIGVSKTHYKIQWCTPSKAPSQVKVSNNNLRLDDVID